MTKNKGEQAMLTRRYGRYLLLGLHQASLRSPGSGKRGLPVPILCRYTAGSHDKQRSKYGRYQCAGRGRGIAHDPGGDGDDSTKHDGRACDESITLKSQPEDGKRHSDDADDCCQYPGAQGKCSKRGYTEDKRYAYEQHSDYDVYFLKPAF